MRNSLCLFLLLAAVLASGCGGQPHPGAAEATATQPADAGARTGTDREPTPVAEPMRRPDGNGARARPGPEPEALHALKAYVGMDLKGVPWGQMQGLLGHVKKLLPGRDYSEWFDFRPRHVWEWKKKGGDDLYVLCEACNSLPHPSYTLVRLTALDGGGQIRLETTFKTAYRCYLHNARLAQPADTDYPILILDTTNGAQCYALIGDRLDLVWLEDPAGNAIRNSYYVRDRQCGPRVPDQSEDAWEADLRSTDRLRVLRALVWLAGSHWDLQPGDADNRERELIADVTLVRKVRGRSGVIGRLRELAGSNDRWLREAASLALSPEDRRF